MRILIAQTLSALMFVLVTAPTGLSQGPTMSPVVARQITVERIYNFTVRRYEPELRIEPAPAQSVSSPESAVRSHFAAMATGDINAFFASWTKAAGDELRQSAARNQNTPYRPEIWAKVLSGRTVSLASRIETGSYVLIHYRIRDASGTVFFEDAVALEREGSEWKLTQALRDDPVLSYWNAERKLIRETIR